MSKPVTAMRLDPHLLEEARKSGINITDFIEAALAKLLKEKKCPYCNQYIEQKRHLKKKKD